MMTPPTAPAIYWMEVICVKWCSMSTIASAPMKSRSRQIGSASRADPGYERVAISRGGVTGTAGG